MDGKQQWDRSSKHIDWVTFSLKFIRKNVFNSKIHDRDPEAFDTLILAR